MILSSRVIGFRKRSAVMSGMSQKRSVAGRLRSIGSHFLLERSNLLLPTQKRRNSRSAEDRVGAGRTRLLGVLGMPE